MRICFVITRTDAIGGGHVHVRDLASALLRLGWAVTVLAGGEGPFREVLAAAQVPFRPLKHLGRSIHPIGDALAARELRRVLCELRPQVVSTHSSKAGWLGRWVGWRLGLPTIFTIHGWAFTEGVPLVPRLCYLAAEKLAGGITRQLIAVSDYDRRLALRHRIVPPERIATIHNGMPDVPADLRADPAHDPPRLVMVARMELQKDQATLLAALSRLRGLPWTLDLVGDGPCTERVVARAAELGLRERVRFLGARKDVAALLSTSQVFVLTSLWEGLPRSIIEAMRAGLPVVASDVGGVSELVEDGVSGFLVPRNDVPAVADRLEGLLRQPTRRAALGQAGRRRYERHFTFARMLDQTREVYRSLCPAEPIP